MRILLTIDSLPLTISLTLQVLLTHGNVVSCAADGSEDPLGSNEARAAEEGGAEDSAGGAPKATMPADYSSSPTARVEAKVLAVTAFDRLHARVSAVDSAAASRAEGGAVSAAPVDAGAAGAATNAAAAAPPVPPDSADGTLRSRRMSGLQVARMQNNHRWTGARSSFARATPDGKGGAQSKSMLGTPSQSAAQRSFRHRLWGHRSRHISTGERFLVDDDSVTEMEVVKGSGHAVGILSVLTGDARYTTALATGPGVAVFLSAEHLFRLFADAAEVAVYAARCAARAALDESAEENTEETVEEAPDAPSRCGEGEAAEGGAAAPTRGAPCGAAVDAAHASQLPHSALVLDAAGLIVARAAVAAGGASAPAAVHWYPGVAIESWRDWHSPLPGAHFAPSAQTASLAPDAGGWHAHHVSELERTFCREAAISAAQMWMRERSPVAAAAAREAGRGAAAWRKLASVSRLSSVRVVSTTEYHFRANPSHHLMCSPVLSAWSCVVTHR